MSHLRDFRPTNASALSRTSAQKGVPRDIQKTTKRTNQPAKISWNLSAQKQKALLAISAAVTLMVVIVLLDRVSSEAIAQSDCQQVIQSGAEMSRGEIAALIAIPAGSSKQAVRQVVSEPYCTLPTEPDSSGASVEAAPSTAKREAYPLAFDPEVWMVLSYESRKYAGYDFVFKP